MKKLIYNCIQNMQLHVADAMMYLYKNKLSIKLSINSLTDYSVVNLINILVEE